MGHSSHHRIPAEFTEEGFIGAFERILSTKTYPRYDVTLRRISQYDEDELGYDGVLSTLVPMYIQFKRPTFYRHTYRGDLARDRIKLFGSTERGFLGFNLHVSANGTYNQHNVLFRLGNRFDTFYLSPHFFRTTQLDDLKLRAPQVLFRFRDLYIHELLGSPLSFARVPLFDRLITIKPHRLVSDKEPSHQYSYDKDQQIAFHSEPEKLVPSLSFKDRLLSLQNQRDGILSIEGYQALLRELFNADNLESPDIRNVLYYYYRKHGYAFFTRTPASEAIERNGLYRLLVVLDDLLRENFSIHQFLIHRHGNGA